MLRLQAGRRSLRVGALVLDLDRTLTDERLRVVPAALQALDRARARGVRTVLATGRTRREIRRRPALVRRFDGLVVEAGGLAGRRGDLRSVARDPAPIGALAAWLRSRGVPERRGVTCLSVAAADEARLRAYPGIAGVALHRNRDRIDVTPPGVDKAVGVRRVLRTSPAAPHVVAFADGENDTGLFELAHYRVAVQNAVPELRRRADEVTTDYGGRGVARFLSQRLLVGEPA